MAPWIITSEELAKCISEVTLVDVRQPEEHAESHIPGCKLIPLGELAARASELNPLEDLVIYCAHGVRSMRGLGILQQLGFQKLRSLEGGIAAWEEFQRGSSSTSR